MVAPLIVGAARMVGGKKFAGRVNARIKRPELLNRIQRRENLKQRREDRKEKMKERAESPLSDTEKSAQNSRSLTLLNRAHRVKRELPKDGLTNVNRIKAFSASIGIFTTAIWFAIPQFIFWMIGLFGLSGASIPLVGYVFPGELMYMMSYVFIVVIGIGTMMYACIFYSVRRVRFFSGYKGIIFILSLTGYLIIFINLFPWFVLWLVAVTYMQED